MAGRAAAESNPRRDSASRLRSESSADSRLKEAACSAPEVSCNFSRTSRRRSNCLALTESRPLTEFAQYNSNEWSQGIETGQAFRVTVPEKPDSPRVGETASPRGVG